MKINSFSNILLLLCLFPYISLFRTSFDTQPFALIFSVFFFSILLVAKGKTLSFSFPLWLIFLVFLYAICLYLIGPNYGTDGLKSLASYASVFFIALASCKTFKYVNLKVYFLSVFTWLFFGVMQLLFSKTFGNWFVPRMATSIGRGVTSLAVEPSYYAIICIFFLVLNEIFHKDTKYGNGLYFVIMFLLLFQIVISLSAMGFLFLMIFFFSKCISVFVFAKGLKKLYMPFLMMIIPILLILSFLYMPILQGKRANILLREAIKSPMSLIFIDQSIAARASDIFLSFYSLIYSSGIGLGLATGANYALLLAGEINNLISVHLVGLGGRIMSGWGSAVYELGIVGVIFILTFLWIVLKGISRNKKMRPVYLSSAITIGSIMLMSVPLAFPLFGYILGIFLYYSNPVGKRLI